MKHLVFSLILIMIAGNLSGCVSEPLRTEKVRDLTFVVLAEEEIPKELLGQIEKKKEQAFRMSYEDKGVLYIAEGYGTQPKTGYSVEAVEVFEAENAVYFHTHLMGPEKGEEVEETPTFPYIVIATETVGKNVVFD